MVPCSGVLVSRPTKSWRLGWYEEERQHPQPFIFTVWATLSGNDRIEDLDETLNYADIQIAIDEVMLKAPEPIRLMEDMGQTRRSTCSPAIRAWLPSPFASKSHGHLSRTPVACP